jgi:flagellar basal body-associated protein FliL
MDSEESPYISYAKEHKDIFIPISVIIVIIIIIIIIIMLWPTKAYMTSGVGASVNNDKWTFLKSTNKDLSQN